MGSLCSFSQKHYFAIYFFSACLSQCVWILLVALKLPYLSCFYAVIYFLAFLFESIHCLWKLWVFWLIWVSLVIERRENESFIAQGGGWPLPVLWWIDLLHLEAKFTLKKPCRITWENLSLFIWDTSFWNFSSYLDIRQLKTYMNGSTKMYKISSLWWKIWKYSTSSIHKKKYITHVTNKTLFYELKSEIAI